MRKPPKKRLNTRYHPNRTVTFGDYKLSIATGGSVYWVSGKGYRKLDAMFQKGALLVSLPDETMITIVQNEKGELLIKGEEVPAKETPEEIK